MTDVEDKMRTGRLARGLLVGLAAAMVLPAAEAAAG